MPRKPKVDPLDFSRNRPSWAEKLRQREEAATTEVDALIEKLVLEEGQTITEEQRQAAIRAKEEGRDFDWATERVDTPVLPKTTAPVAEDDVSVAATMSSLPSVVEGLGEYFMSNRRARQAGKKLSEIQEEEDNSGLVRDFIREATGLEGSLDPRQNAENVMRLISPAYRKVKIEEDRKTRELEKAEAKRVLVEEEAKAKSLEERLGTGLIPRIARVTGGVSADAVEQALPIVGGILGGPGGAAAGSLPMAQVAYADARREALEQFDATPEEATNYARAMTAVEFGTEALGGGFAAEAIGKLGIKKLTKDAVQEALVKKVRGRVSRIAGGTFAEGAEEIAAEGAGDLIRTGLEQSDALSTEESRAKLRKYNATQAATRLDRYLDSFIGGSAAGGIISAPAAQLSYASELGKQTAETAKAAEETYRQQVEAGKKREAEDLKADTELNEDIRLEQERLQQEQAKEDAFKKAEQERATAEEQAAREKEVEEEAAFRTIETEDKFRGQTRVERAGDSLVERVPVNPPAETTPEQVKAEREQAATDEAERLDRVELGGLTEQLRKRQDSLTTKTAAEQAKADKAAKGAESRRRRVIMDTLIKENPEATPADLAPLLRERLKQAPTPAEQAAPAATKPVAEQPGTTPTKALPEATKPDKEMQDADVDELAQGLANLGTLNTVGTTPAADTRKQVEDFKPKLARAIKNLVRRNTGTTADVQNLIRQGKVVFAPNPQSIGRDPKEDTGAATYDTATGKMHVYLDKTDPDDVMAVIANTLHEATHAGQFNDRKGRPNILKQMMGQEKYNAVKKAIIDSDGKNTLATRAVAAAKAANPDVAIQDLELVPYFVQEAANARQGFGRLGGAVRDIQAGAKGFLRDKLGVDLDISLAEIDSAAQKVAGEIVQTPITDNTGSEGTLNTIGGRGATGFRQAAAEGRNYRGRVDAKERFEIPDNAAELNLADIKVDVNDLVNNGKATSAALGKLLNHEKLFANYPELADMRVFFGPKAPGSHASYHPNKKNITVDSSLLQFAVNGPEAPSFYDTNLTNEEFLRRIILHETQHAIQDIEGFVAGANQSSLIPKSAKNRVAKAQDDYQGSIAEFELAQAIKTLRPEARQAWQDEMDTGLFEGRADQVRNFLEQGFHEQSTDAGIKQQGRRFFTAKENLKVERQKLKEAEKRAWQDYIRDYGETEARNTEFRSRMDPELLTVVFPEDTMGSAEYGISADQTINSSTHTYSASESESASPAFKTWFGDSVATNPDGTPKTFYTGTSKDKEFTGFRVPKNGVWFTDDPKVASQYAVENDSMSAVYENGRFRDVNTKSRVFPVHLKAENPYVITDADADAISKGRNGNYKQNQAIFFDKLKAQGYDSVIWDGTVDNPKVLVIIKEPSQIKSVNNSGKYSNKPDVLNSAGVSRPVVRDENGKPMRMFTGTTGPYNKEHKGVTWVTPERAYALSFAHERDSQLSAVYVREGNYFDFTKPEDIQALLNNNSFMSKMFGLVPRNVSWWANALKRGDEEAIDHPEVFNALKDMGYDGAYVEVPSFNEETTLRNLAVFDKSSLVPLSINLATTGTSNVSKAWEGSRVREILLRTLSSSLGAGDQVRELMEHANSAPSKDRMLAEGSLAKYHNALNYEAARRNMTPAELNEQIGREIETATQDTTGYNANKAAFDSVVDNYGNTGQHLKNLRDQIDTLTREIVRQRIAQGNPLTKKEENLYKKMLANLGKYNHRQYASNLAKVGDKYSQAIWDAYAKGKNKSRADRENFNRVANAVDWLINHELVIPEDLDAASDEQINNLHGTWVGGPNASDKTIVQKREELEAVRDDVNNNPERIKAQAERTVQEILGIIADPGTVATYFRGGKRDNTIIKQRENIPSPLRELMGEIKDVGATLMVTAAKQAEFIARTNMFMELTKVEDGSVAPPSAAGTPAVEGKVKLEGETYGPMEGWYVVNDLKLMLDDAVTELATFDQATALAVKNPRWFRNAVLTGVADKWAKVAGISKALQIIVQPFNFVYNYAGAYGMMMMNGNASPTAWAKGHKAIIDVVANAISPAYSSKILTELNQYGVTDSAFVGDLKAEQYQQLARVAKDMAGLSPSQVMGVLGKLKIGGKELYAMMDVWSKAANFYHQVDVLTNFYKAEGVPRTDAQIRREAADVTNGTNLTYKRAAPIVRGVEAGGGTAYGVYFYEVFRTQVNNLKQAFAELERSNNAKTYKGRLVMGMQANKRLFGQLAFWAGVGKIASFAAGLVFGDDEEDKRSLLPEWMQDQDFLPVGIDKLGDMVLFQWSRVDPIGPATDLMRAVINKDADLKEVAGKMFDLYVAPRLVPQIVTAVRAVSSDTAKVNKEPTLKLVAPDAWSEMTRLSPLPDKVDRALWNIAEAFSPGFVSSWRENNARPVGDDPASQFFNVMSYAGLNLYKMDAKAAATQQARKSKDQLKSARDQLTLFFDDHPDATPNEVSELISELEADEQKNFEDLTSIYRGAKAIGMEEADITKSFLAAGLSRKQLAQLRTSKFTPTVVSQKSLDTHKANDLADAETEEEKALVEAEWKKINQIVEVSQKSLEEEE